MKQGVPAVGVRGLTKSFGDQRAVDGITFSAAEGEVFGLVGPDGAGKTTTIRLLCGLLLPDAGEIRVLGLEMPRETERLRELLGYLPQRFALYGDLTVGQNMDFFADIFRVPRQESVRRKSELLSLVGLERFTERYAADLSGGMKQKLGLACALVHRPRILFLDEPTAGVDPVSRRDFWELIHEFAREGINVFFSTAYLDEAERAHRVGLMQAGRLLLCDSPAALRGLLAGRVAQVTSDDPRKALKLLSDCPGVQVAALVGGAARAVTKEPLDRCGREVEADLRARGIEARVEAVEPSLEDVFALHTGGQPSPEEAAPSP
jgi:ABC-2 type transport system ATP-binding protein